MQSTYANNYDPLGKDNDFLFFYFYRDNQERTDRFVVGEIQEIGIILEYGTLLEDAFNSRVEFTLPLQFDFRQREDSLMVSYVHCMR